MFLINKLTNFLIVDVTFRTEHLRDFAFSDAYTEILYKGMQNFYIYERSAPCYCPTCLHL